MCLLTISIAPKVHNQSAHAQYNIISDCCDIVTNTYGKYKQSTVYTYQYIKQSTVYTYHYIKQSTVSERR